MTVFGCSGQRSDDIGEPIAVGVAYEVAGVDHGGEPFVQGDVTDAAEWPQFGDRHGAVGAGQRGAYELVYGTRLGDRGGGRLHDFEGETIAALGEFERDTRRRWRSAMFDDTAAVIDMATGEVRAAQIFVAVMGASKYAYAEANWTQALPDWIASNIRTLEFMNGSPALLIPDNLKSAIKNACPYEPEGTSTYEDFARHYGTAILPARPFRPKDKANASYYLLC